MDTTNTAHDDAPVVSCATSQDQHDLSRGEESLPPSTSPRAGERALATVRIVREVRPIAGADKVELAEIDGWQVVVKRGEFAVGDMCIYFEIDSFLPVAPHFEFLRAACFKHYAHLGAGFRLKTVRLRGELSQGLALPPHVLPPLHHLVERLREGDDVTDLLQVKKYEPQVPLSVLMRGLALTHADGANHQRGAPSTSLIMRGPFPDFLVKTDQPRIQNCWYKLLARDDITALRFEVTLKLDGSSLTAYFRDGVFGVCSRNCELQPSFSNTFWAAARHARLEQRLRYLGRNVALQGELMGPGIQLNREALSRFAFYLFAAYDIDARRYLLPDERMALLAQLNAVPESALALVPENADDENDGSRAATDSMDTETHAAVDAGTAIAPSTPEVQRKQDDRKAATAAASEPDHVRRARLAFCDAGPQPVLHAPIIDPALDLMTFTSIRHALTYADRPSLVHPIAEGVVLKCTTLRHLTFKIVSNRYLIKCDS